MSAIWNGFISLIQQALLFFEATLSSAGIPFAFGFGIILFTILVKALTYPLNVKQIRTSKAQQEIQPKLKAIQKKYADDREGLAKAQMELYKEHGINPLGGCLPMLVQMPIWFGLYRALFELARMEPTPLTEGFLWIPSLAGPVPPIEEGFTGGIDWLIPGSEGFLGWAAVVAYLILPILLVISQLYTQRMMMPQSDDPQQKMMAQIMNFMPLMFGYFALVVPSALTLYWFTSNTLTLIQQYFMMKERNAVTNASETVADVVGEIEKPLGATQLEVSPATAAIDNGSKPKPKPKKKQDSANARRKSRKKSKRKQRR